MQVLTLMEELKLQAFENEAFRKIFVAQKNEVTRDIDYTSHLLLLGCWENKEYAFLVWKLLLKCIIGRPRCEVDITSSGHVKWVWVVFNLRGLLPEFISYIKKTERAREYIKRNIKDILWDNVIGLVIRL